MNSEKETTTIAPPTHDQHVPGDLSGSGNRSSAEAIPDLNQQESPEQTIKRLERDIKKADRRIQSLEGLIRRSNADAKIKSNLGDKIMAERSREEKYLNLMLQGSPDIIFLLDNTGRIAYCTDAFLHMTGLTNFGLISGRLIGEVLDPYRSKESSEEAERVLEGVYNGESFAVEQEFDFALSGEQRIFKISVSPLVDDNGQVDGAILMYHDQTDIRRAQAAAEAASAAKTAFLAKTSHEIRTPMNAIVGMSELLLQEHLSAAGVEYAVNIKQAGANLLSIINDILDFSKIESGKLEIVPVDYQLSSLVNDIVNVSRMKIMSRPIHFITFIDANLPNELRGDVVRIRQVLINLLSNAMKYTNEGMVKLSITGEYAHDNNLMLHVDVEDTGIGINLKDQKKLFDDFSQVDTQNNINIEGTGLGLAIARSLALAMGGDIRVKSEYGKGSTFSFSFPQKAVTTKKVAVVDDVKNKRALIYLDDPYIVDSAEEICENLELDNQVAQTFSDFGQILYNEQFTHVITSHSLLDSARSYVETKGEDVSFIVVSSSNNLVAMPDVRVLPMPIHSVSLAMALNDSARAYNYQEKGSMIEFEAPRARVLLVDDIFTNLRVAEALMKSSNMEIDKCTRGEDAIKMVQQNDYDIVFMDHMMPGMDGIEATAEIRKIKGDSLPIVALTANAVSGMKKMFLENGFDDFLAKPIELAKLNAVLSKWIAEDKKQKPGRASNETKESVVFEIPGVNIEQGLIMTGGSMKSYLEVLAAFVSDCNNFLEEFAEPVDSDSLSLYTTRVHGLKGAAATLGAQNISDRARLLEEAGKRTDLDFISNNTPEFFEHLNAFLSASQNVLKPEKEEAGDPNNLISRLLNLKDALENYNVSDADEILTEITADNWGPDISKSLNAISDDVLVSDYEEAIIKIDQLVLTVK